MFLISGRLLVGLAILVVGILLLLSNLGLGIEIDIRRVISFWPILPLVAGLNWLYLSFRTLGPASEGKRLFFPWGQFVTALLAISIGVIYLGRNLELFEVDTGLFWRLLWPVVLILIGVSLLRGRSASGTGGSRFSFMGGASIGGAEPWKLESGSYFAFMGGIEMDLRAAELADGETIIDLTAIMGGIEVKLPKDTAVIYEGSAVLGGVTFAGQDDGGLFGGRRIEHNVNESSEKILRIQARAIMGGVEIKDS